MRSIAGHGQAQLERSTELAAAVSAALADIAAQTGADKVQLVRSLEAHLVTQSHLYPDRDYTLVRRLICALDERPGAPEHDALPELPETV
ncbi:hypothetical protein GCM10007989_04930 [Devosia pacifica]|uniref:Uncharacterized protein n=1 Tax=Devosia pacifica TaxID=1335967 RepID=A0A918VML6_9HYPH|nr:hypothetical protein [Devosia pacifica]GHA13347.1 hypothetical protein GCM10007989_04930 [Devosia pacifica]